MNGSIARKCKACISVRSKDKYVTITRVNKVKNPSAEYRPMNVKHGEFGTRLYGIWGKMLARCRDENDLLYGGRGIKVCEDWLEYTNFSKWAKQNGYDDNLTIDRKENNGNYEPSNCRWTNAKQQANNRRSNRMVSYLGITKTLQQWADELDIKTATLRYRLNNWPIDKAMSREVGV